jgi:hypothetical protein
VQVCHMLNACMPTQFSLSVIETLPGEPVDAAFCRLNARVRERAAEDAWFDIAIPTARGIVERLTRRTLLRTQYRMECSGFQGINQHLQTLLMELPKGPALELVSLAYRRTDGTYVQLDVDSSGIAQIVREDPRGESSLALRYGQQWPQTVSARDAVVVEWWAGCLAAGGGQTQAQRAAAACPSELRLLIAQVVAHLYENRDPVTQLMGAIPEDVESQVGRACRAWRLV